MSTLHVRNVPEPLYETIRGFAHTANRSIGAEVVELLDHAVTERRGRSRMKRLLAEMRRNRFRPPAGAPTAEELLREDRDR
jgi:plasmid stability protein